MKQKTEDISSEEEIDEPVRRPNTFRMITSHSTLEQEEPQKTKTVQFSADENLQQQKAIEAAKARQQEVLQKARTDALRLQAEAKARAEAARAEQVRQYQLQQQQLKNQQQKVEQDIKKNQLDQNLMNREKTIQKQQIQPQKNKLQENKQQDKLQENQRLLLQKNQTSVNQQQQNKLQGNQPQQQNKLQENQQNKMQESRQLQSQPNKNLVNQQQQNKLQGNQPQQQNKLQENQQQQKKLQENHQLQPQKKKLEQPKVPEKPKKNINQQQQSQTKNNLEQNINNKTLNSNEKNQQKVEVNKNQEKNVSFGEYPPPILNHYSKINPQESNPVLNHQLIEDSSWQLQRRVPQNEIQIITPERIVIPEFNKTTDVKPTVIVPLPAQSTRVQWNEFPQEEEKEQVNVPRIRTKEWNPNNEVEHIVQKTTYQPNRINRAWPPLENNEDKNDDIRMGNKTKALSDDEWIQLNKNLDENNDINDKGRNSPWQNQTISSGNIRNRVWPPPENVVEDQEISTGPKLNVQWPPSEIEEKELQDIQIIQTHLPIKPQQRQWPPVLAQ